jgi:hypothetical protein
MSNADCTCLLLCYKRFSPLAIEISSIILSLFGAIITYCGLLIIPFRIDSKIYKIFFLVNIPFFVLIIILNFTFIIFRHFDLIYNNLYLLSFIISIVEIYISLFGFITNLIDDSLIINNMKFYQKLSLRKKSKKYPMITLGEWVSTGIVFAIIFLVWINFLLLNLTDNLLINLKINGSYHLYQLAMMEEKKHNEQSNTNGSTTGETVNENDINHVEVTINNNLENIQNNNENNIVNNNFGDNLKNSDICFLDDKNKMDKNLGKYEEKKQ